jgi:hypothetical protein
MDPRMDENTIAFAIDLAILATRVQYFFHLQYFHD